MIVSLDWIDLLDQKERYFYIAMYQITFTFTQGYNPNVRCIQRCKINEQLMIHEHLFILALYKY